MTLEKTPYTNPDNDEEREQKLYELQEALRIDEVQFGVFYRPSYPRNPKDPPSQRAFAIEWGKSYVEKSLGWLRFEYDHKLLRAEVIVFWQKFGRALIINCSSEIP